MHNNHNKFWEGNKAHLSTNIFFNSNISEVWVKYISVSTNVYVHMHMNFLNTFKYVSKHMYILDIQMYTLIM